MRKLLSSVFDGTTLRIPIPGSLPQTADKANPDRVRKSEVMTLFQQDLSQMPEWHQSRARTSDKARR